MSVAPDSPDAAEPISAAAASAPPPSPLEGLNQAVRSGANWFLWIAGLSALNTALSLSGEDRSFVVGLGVTQVIDALFGKDAPMVAGTLDGLVLVGFVALRFVATKHPAGFVVGMVVYGLDTLIFVATGGWLPVALHLLVLFFLWQGWKASRARATAQRPFLHAPSGAAFPGIVGSSVRTWLQTYDEAGLDVSATWQDQTPGAPFTLTLYVYPSTAQEASSLPAQFERVIEEIQGAHPQARLVSRTPRDAVGGSGAVARWELSTPAEDGSPLQQVSELRLRLEQGWFVKVRVTCPADQETAVRPAVQRVLDAVVPPSRAPGLSTVPQPEAISPT